MILTSTLLGLLFIQPSAEASAHLYQDPDVSKFFTQVGTDPTFEELLQAGKLPSMRNTTMGVKGSKISINKRLVESLPESRSPIPKAISLHTLLNSSILRKDFPKWTRWYQEDGNTQVFRLFKGEVNRRNERPLAARVEAFSNLKWTEAEGAWHEWSGVVTAIKPVGMNLQVKNTVNDWAVSIVVGRDGRVKVNHRRGVDEYVAENMIGKPFLLTVRDNGRDYEVYLDDKKVGSGSFSRPIGTTSFRWGMYVGEKTVDYDAMIFFSGVKIDG